MKLDPQLIRFLTNEQFRVLVAVEMGMRNHDLVPTPLIRKISSLRTGGFSGILGAIAKMKLIHHEAKIFDGYRLTYLGYDFLALKTFCKRGTVVGVGRQIGVGKESDVYIVNQGSEVKEDEKSVVSHSYEDDESVNVVREAVLKLERLGRTSFRKVKSKRDYLKKRSCGNWLYLSRLAAQKEYLIMETLYKNDFPVPKPIDQNRHCIIMGLIEGALLNNIYEYDEIEQVKRVFHDCLDLIEKFAEHGLVHADFNEFNVLVEEETGKTWVIDFPQMVSVTHRNAEEFYKRDWDCIIIFFKRRFGIELEERKMKKLSEIKVIKHLDLEMKLSGFDEKNEKEFRRIRRVERKKKIAKDNDDDDNNSQEEEEEEEEGEGEEDDDESNGEENESEDEEDGERKRRVLSEDEKIRFRVKRGLERKKFRKKVYKEARKKAKKGRRRKQFWSNQL